MKKLFVFLLVIVFASCKKDEKLKTSESNEQLLRFSITDSVKLNKNYVYFDFNKYSKDSIYTLVYPQLQLDLLDKKGALSSNITQKGTGPGEINDLGIITTCNNKVFLVECSNYYRLFVFDALTQNYITSVDLQSQTNSQLSPYPLLSSLNVSKRNNKYIITFAAASSDYHFEDKELYKNISAIAEFTLNANFELLDYQEKLPFNAFTSLKNSINENERFWDQPVVQYKQHRTDNIIVPFFSDSIFIYSNNWSLKKTLKIQAENKKAFKADYKRIETTEKRLKQDFALRFANRNFYSIDIYDDKLYLMYPKTITLDAIPTNSNEYNAFTTNPILLIIDLESDEQYQLELPKKISYFSGFKVIDNNSIVIPSNSMYQEDLYLYNINYDLNSND